MLKGLMIDNISQDRKTKNWTYRKVIPAELRGIAGKTEQIRSLGTKDENEAKRRASVVIAEMEAQAEGWRDALRPVMLDLPLTIKAIERWRDGEIGRHIRTQFGTAPGSPERAAWLTEQHRLDVGLAAETYWTDVPEFDETLASALAASGIIASVTNPCLLNLRPEFRNAWRTAVTHAIQAVGTGNWSSVASMLPAPVAHRSAKLAETTRDGAFMVSQVASEYVEAMKPVDQDVVRKEFRMLIEFIGGDKPAKLLTKKEVREYEALLRTLPANLRIHQRLLPIRELPASKEADQNVLTPLGVKNKIAYLCRGFNWAVRAGKMDEHPIPLKIDTPKRDGETSAREAFNGAQIKDMFSQPIWTGTERPGIIGEAAYWVPLMSLYMNFRVGEVTQLLVTDVKLSDDGIDYIKSWRSDEAGKECKRVKTMAGKRDIPIHPWLIEHGFLDYVEWVKAQGSFRLFPSLSDTKDGQDLVPYRSDDAGLPRNIPAWEQWTLVAKGRVSNWFTRWRAQNEIAVSTLLTFHSFRHTWDACADENRMDQIVKKEMFGHSRKKLYATKERISLKRCAEEMARIVYPTMPDIPKWQPGKR